MEEALEEIGAKLGVEPRQIMQQIRSLLKGQGPGGGGSQGPDRWSSQGER